MKKYVLEFIKRGLMCSVGGPIILGIIYGILGATGTVTAITPKEACLGIISLSVMAFIAAGITVVYSAHNLPLISAILLHGGVLYLDYLLMYLINDWIPKNFAGIGIFTAIFVVGFAVVWLIIYFSTKRKTDSLNKKLHG